MKRLIPLLLALVGTNRAAQRMGQYPHQFSGGMRQRAVMAIALAGRPRILIADEPTTALDVTIQAQILDLLRQIQRKPGTAAILVFHDLGVVARAADRAAVMYTGDTVELGTAEEIYYDPRQPYTWALMRVLPLALAVFRYPPDLSRAGRKTNAKRYVRESWTYLLFIALLKLQLFSNLMPK